MHHEFPDITVVPSYPQFMQEMSAAWQNTVDLRLGLFTVDRPEVSPLVHTEGQPLKPDPPFVIPHNIWTKVRLELTSLGRLGLTWYGTRTGPLSATQLICFRLHQQLWKTEKHKIFGRLLNKQRNTHNIAARNYLCSLLGEKKSTFITFKEHHHCTCFLEKKLKLEGTCLVIGNHNRFHG